MLQGKQIDRLVLKVARLNEVYAPFLTEEILPQEITFIEGNNRRLIHEGEHWGKDFACASFSFVAQGLQKGKQYRIFAETGGVEHQIFVNGRRVGIIDYVEDAVNPEERIHKYVLLEGLKNGDEVCLEAYYSHDIPGTMPYEHTHPFALSGTSSNRSFKQISLVVFYSELYQFCQKLQALNSLYQSQQCFEKAQSEKVYIKLFEILSLEEKRPEAAALKKATKIIDEFFEEIGKNQGCYVGIIGHSHLDTAWLWTTDETHRKLLRTVSNAVTLLKRHPDYKFFMSTVLYLKWIEQSDKQLFEEVSDLIKQGRFEPNGSTWVECDGNLTGAEAFCRQFLRGKRYLRQKFGYEADVFWLPDTFGYSAALPQIMKLCNVKYFLTTKLSWNDTNKFPYQTFVWKGIDGSEIPVHFNTIHCWADEKSVGERLSALNKRESDCALIAYGFGDGGGGPSEEMVQRALYTQQHCSQAKVEHTTVSQFMQRATDGQLPTYFGELYLELHRGTYTTNHKLKQNNRRLEEALHDAELISVLVNDRTAKQLTDNLYDVLLLNQFHDILPGTCIAEATDMAISQQQAALAEAQKYILGNGETCYFNTLGFARTEILPAQQGQTYTDLFGCTRTVAPFEFSPYGYAKPTTPNGKLEVFANTITTPQLTAKIENGVITSLVYNGREFVGGGFNIVKCAEDIPFIYDNWDIDADYVLKEKPMRFVSQEMVSCGETLVVVRTKFQSGNTHLTTDIKFRTDVAMVEFETKLVTADTHNLVRTYFDTTLFSQHYNCETQFGFVERNCYPHDSTDIAKFEVCAHKWTDLSEKNCGLSLLSDSKYGVSCSGKTVGLTLHKSGTHPDARGDVGESSFRYALFLHDGALGMETIKQGYCFNLSPVRTSRQNLVAPFALQSKSVVAETTKHGEDCGIVVRMYESLGATDVVTFQAQGKTICLCNILEDEIQQLGVDSVTLTFTPFEIKTLLLK